MISIEDLIDSICTEAAEGPDGNSPYFPREHKMRSGKDIQLNNADLPAIEYPLRLVRKSDGKIDFQED